MIMPSKNTTKLVLVFVTLVSCFATTCSAQTKKARRFEQMAAEAGTIDGAIWSFRLEPKNQGPKAKEIIRGKFRVSDLKIYQSETPEGEMSKQIGLSKPQGKERVSIAEFEQLQGMTIGREQIKLKGKALLHAVKTNGGGIEGDFTDSAGLKWTMTMKRVQE
jgi:hypothetical protein